MLIIILCSLNIFISNLWINAAPSDLTQIKYPLSRDEAFHKLKDRSDFIFDFYYPRPIDIIEGADAGQTVRPKVSRKTKTKCVNSKCLFLSF